MTNVEYSFQYHGVLMYRLGQFGIHLTSDGKIPYVIGRRFGHEEDWKNQAARDSILDGHLKSEIQWILESHFEMPQSDSAWFAQQINDDFVKYLESKNVKLGSNDKTTQRTRQPNRGIPSPLHCRTRPGRSGTNDPAGLLDTLQREDERTAPEDPVRDREGEGGAGMSLKECPFCGGVSTRTELIRDEGLWYVVCECCEAIGPTEITSTLAELYWNEGTPRHNRVHKLKVALERIRDCDFVITLPDRMDAVRAIAREALE